tara:strand:+ start:14643 stop:14792 length:150 start_codon:yes stop_codon:yes gene_type:complete
MLKVKTKYLEQKPPHSKVRLGEYSQRDLQNLPDYLKNEYCVVVKKDKKK